MELPVDQAIKDLLVNQLDALEQHLQADVLWYYGSLQDGAEQTFLELIEQLAEDKRSDREPEQEQGKIESLYIILTTPGGSAFAVERIVNIVRNHYDEVNFIIPNYAYSAGTIFCMSGDKILMDYYSVLGPIDPQVLNKEGKMVPALGYLDKINELIEKAKKNTLTQAEFIILKEFDLAELRGYEQAKALTIDLLKKWLVQYKFKNWIVHKNGIPVTQAEKMKRAEELRLT
jgi:hypothetical protein